MRILKSLFISFLAFLVVCAAFSLYISDKYVVPIMMYHHVEETDTFKPKTTSPHLFDWQMAFLRKYGYNIISLEELVTSLEEGRTLPRKSIVITFDDGYEDNYTQAFKVLKKYDIPATFFVSSHLVGQEHYMTWQQLKEVQDYNITIGSHSREHDYLPSLSKEEQWAEVTVSKQFLEERLGTPVEYFAYPSGGFTQEIKKMLQEAGYKGACATNRGNDQLNKDLYELNRIRLSDRDNSPFILWAKFSGYYNVFRKTKSPY